MIASAVLEARGVDMTLGNGAGAVRALKSVNLSVVAGELTLVMGPSGSGKTTLLSILGCILTQTQGKVLVAGQSTTGLDAEALAKLRRQHIGFVFQSYNLFPTLTALQNVRLALAVRDASGSLAVRKASSALEVVGLAHKLHDHPRHLSGGEQQRVAIARAIVGEPSAILADEPTSALDSENGRSVMALFSKIAKEQGCAVLVVTHDARTRSMADRTVHMEDGRIVDPISAVRDTTDQQLQEAVAHA